MTIQTILKSSPTLAIDINYIRPNKSRDIAIEAHSLSVYYNNTLAAKNINLVIARNKITAIIGPSGCGKSTLLRSFNRMNELIPSSRTTGEVYVDGINIYQKNIDPIEIRRRIGMVFQRPNPFPQSINNNDAWRLKHL